MPLNRFVVLFYIAETGYLPVAVGPIQVALEIFLPGTVQPNGFIVLNLIDKTAQTLELMLSFRL